MFKVDVAAPDIPKQLQKLYDYPRVAREEFVAAMGPALSLGVDNVRGMAPIASGHLVSTVSSSIKFAVGDEVRGVITADATGANGFPYGYALDASNKYRFAGSRKRTKGWMKGVIKRKREAIYALFAGAAVKIVNRLAVHGGVAGEL